MRKTWLAAFAVALLFLIPLSAVNASGETGSNETVTIDGYIYHNNEARAATVEMILYEKDGYVEKTTYDDENNVEADGHFSFEFTGYDSAKTYAIEFRESGFAVSKGNVGSGLKPIDDEPNVFEITAAASSGIVTLSTENSATLMLSSFGSISGKIVSSKGENPIVNGAKVTLLKNGKSTGDYALSEGQGEFVLENVKTFTIDDKNEYSLLVEKSGFDSVKVEITEDLTSGKTITVNEIKITPNDELDTAHMMMFGGILCALILIALVVYHVTRKK